VLQAAAPAIRSGVSVRRWKALDRLVVLGLLVAACNDTSIPDLQRVLDGIHPPAEWRLAVTRTYGPGGDVDCAPFLLGCPSVTRYYVATGTARDAFQPAQRMLTAAGYRLDRDASKACSVPSGGPVCTVRGLGDDGTVMLSVFPPQADFGDGAHIGNPNGPIVELTAFPKKAGTE
jgi:hypothetical protein